jgi:hypothetical protein
MNGVLVISYPTTALVRTTDTVPLPVTGSLAYISLQLETGLVDLTGFHYGAYLAAKATPSLADVAHYLNPSLAPSLTPLATSAASLLGSAVDDKLVYLGKDFVVLLGGAGADELVAGAQGSLLVPGTGNNTVTGGPGLDVVLLTDTLPEAFIGKTPEGLWVVLNALSRDTNLLTDVERIVFEDVSLALDLRADQAAGQTAMILGAVFGKNAIRQPDWVGLGLSLFDQNTDFTAVCTLAMSVLQLTAPKDVVEVLWTHVVGSAPTDAQALPFVDMLNAGMTPGELAAYAAQTDLNLSQIDLIGLAETGILYL